MRRDAVACEVRPNQPRRCWHRYKIIFVFSGVHGASRRLGPKEINRINARLPENGSKRALRQIARVIRDCSVPIGSAIEPDFVTPGRLAVETETEYFQFAADFPVSKSSESTHLRCDNDGVVAPLARGWKIGDALALAKRLNEFSCHVAGDV